jgi:hypothetical protein
MYIKIGLDAIQINAAHVPILRSKQGATNGRTLFRVRGYDAKAAVSPRLD